MKTYLNFNPNKKINNKLIFTKKIILGKKENIQYGGLDYPFRTHHPNHPCCYPTNNIKNFVSMGFGFEPRNKMFHIRSSRIMTNINVPRLLIILNMIKFNNIYWLTSIRFGHVVDFNDINLDTKVYPVYLDAYHKNYTSCPTLGNLVFADKDISKIVDSTLHGFWNSGVNSNGINGSISNYINTNINYLTFNLYKNENSKNIIRDVIQEHFSY